MRLSFLRVYAVATVLLSTSLLHAKEFIHPGIAHTKESLQLVRSKIAADELPWTKEWKRLLRSPYASLSWQPQPREHVERGPYNEPDIGSTEFSDDSAAAYTHAIQWAISGKEAHAKKAAEILDAWSSTLKTVGNHDAKLLIGMQGHRYCNAAELLKHTWNGWPQPKQDQFSTMLRTIWYPTIKDFYPSANGNWDAAMIQTMLAMGIFLDDHEMFNRAKTYYLEGEGNGAVRNYFKESGQCQESGRDQSHTQMGLDFLATSCEIAWNQGVDLYSAFDNRLLKGFEYTAKYNLGNQVPYEPYTSFNDRYHYKSISNKGRGRLRPMYEKVYNHYHNRKNMELPYTSQAVKKVRKRQNRQMNQAQDLTQQTRKRKKRFGTIPWGTLMFADLTESFIDAEETAKPKAKAP